MRIEIPEFSLVAMVGATSSGKTTFAKTHFRPTEILSSDFFRAMVSDDETDQSVSEQAFELLFRTAEKRLELKKLTVIDATNVSKQSRSKIVDLAKNQDVHAVAIVLDIPEKILLERNSQRDNRRLPERIVRNHRTKLRQSIKNLKREGFRYVFVLKQEDIDDTEIVRTKLWNDKRDLHGPFDIIGDVHGCCTELEKLLRKLGYVKNPENIFYSPTGRKALFLGDFCDRGDRNTDVLKLVISMVNSGNALAVVGNHDVKLVKYLRGRKVQLTHGLEKTVEEINSCSDDFRKEVCGFLDGLISHYVLDSGRLVIAHAGIKEKYIGRGSGRIREFCLYGDVTGENDEYGLPVRLDWTEDYTGNALVVYGHTAVSEVRYSNNTYCIDTGCVFGGKLSALRYPEREIVSVDAEKMYCEPTRPLDVKDTHTDDGLLSADAFQGNMNIETCLIPVVNISKNNSAGAMEIMSRFAVDPRWLIYLPPTMSPCETSCETGYLEYPTEAFEYYKNHSVGRVVCEKKHMGSRAVIVLCRDVETAEKYFHVENMGRGVIYTRTGRKFFDDNFTQNIILDRLDEVLKKSNFWEDFGTNWLCLDVEIMPWSEKAQSLIKNQYAGVANSGINSLGNAEKLLGSAVCVQADTGLEKWLEMVKFKKNALEKYAKAYGEYCWAVESVDDLKIAPFHILACEGRVFGENSHIWHMENIKKYLTGFDKIFVETPYICVETDNPESVKNGTEWWLEITASGGEGMVVKPENFTEIRDGKLLQPAVKCRGREYLRIIYGAEYLQSENLERLKKRSLTRKRTLALKEFSLGIESLKRFTSGESLSRVHECAFGVLALESEPVDPRL